MSVLDKSFSVLEAILEDAGQSSVAAIARQIDLPVATVHRHVSALVRQGLLAPLSYGRHFAGPRLRSLAPLLQETNVLTIVANEVLKDVADQTRCVVHLGTLDQSMVTYRVKVGRGSAKLFTRVGYQLEAYCSAIGKVLLATLPPEDLENYLAGGPFVALTKSTVTEPDVIRAELGRVARQGFAVDAGEIADGLRCVAVPVFNGAGKVVAAISASKYVPPEKEHEDQLLVAQLHAGAEVITRKANFDS